MGWARAVVAVVLSIISLGILSLHVALCVHYPSPLFAVTLLLNPSLWMFLGAAGMGCALALTYRERQRKVRAALCTTCHARYGATIDSKCRGPDSQWRDGGHCQRGPSRAIYSYNGNSHKFYASYGTINEKQTIKTKRPSVLGTTTGIHSPTETLKLNETTPLNTNRKPPTSCEPVNTVSSNNDTISAAQSKNSDESVELQQRPELKSNSEPMEWTGDDQALEVKSNDTLASPSLSQEDRDDAGSVVESPEIHEMNQQASRVNLSVRPITEVTPALTVNSDVSGDVTSDSRTSSTSLEERLPCDCLARYAIMDYRSRQQLYRTATYGPTVRRHHYTHPEIRAVGRYNKKLLMHCRLRDPKDVPIELFTAKHSSVKNCSADQNVTPDEVVGCGCGDVFSASRETSDNQTTYTASEHHTGDQHIDNNPRTDHLKFNNNTSTDKERTQEINANSEPVSPQTRLFTLGKVTDEAAYYPTTTKLLPVKHSPPSPIQTPTTGQDTASPPSVASASVPQNLTQDRRSHHSTQGPIREDSVDSCQAQDPKCRDLDDASVSSESGLLPSSSKASSVGRDFLKSPLWRSFRGVKKDVKAASGGDSDQHRESGQLQPDSDAPQPESSGSQHRSGQHRLKSLLSSSRRALTRPKRMRFSGASERRTPLRFSQASPSTFSSSRDTPTSMTTLKERRSPSLTLTMRKSKITASSSCKNGSTFASPLPSSPARAVKSLVMRNIHRTTGRSSKSSGPVLTPETTTAGGSGDKTDLRAPQDESPPPYSTSPASTSSSPCPSVRPKERKKQKTRLKSKHHAGSTDSVLLLSDDTTE
ncbi:uncharacterized protein [Procambarus clarkii]|uniref:uncharacterized protein n=1 Tax=Procambarus clarkii TaxID=6728 RepID=UPI001E6719CB|nr:uncharacterized protein LOC123756388 [Procambarus clarkii]